MANVNSGNPTEQELQPVIGDSLAGVADSGSEPVKIGGVTNSTQLALASGQRVAAQFTPQGELIVAIRQSNQIVASDRPSVDAVSASSNVMDVMNFGLAYNGSTWDRKRTPNKFVVIDALAVGTEATIWTPGAGKKFRLMGAVLAASAAVTLKLRDNTAGTVIREVLLEASKSIVLPFEGNGSLSAAANNVLTAAASAAANLTGYVYGTEE